MAIRNIVKEGEDVLRKKSREVTVFDQRLWDLLDDMAQTMYKANGVGLAAVQVGILKRAVVIDLHNSGFQTEITVSAINNKLASSLHILDYVIYTRR